MNKQDYLQELKAHDWTYDYASGDRYYKGQANEKRLLEIANSNPEFADLYKAYSAHIWSGTEAPTIEEHPQRPQQYNLRAIMKDAWEIANEATRRLGGQPSEYFAVSLKQAWAKAKARTVAQQITATTIETVYIVCVDQVIDKKTKRVNQPAVDATYIDFDTAQRALAILSRAYKKPFIKTRTGTFYTNATTIHHHNSTP